MSGKYPKELQEVIDKLKMFVSEREWGKYHDPKNLSMSVAIEAAELAEIFQWVKSDDSVDRAEKEKEHLSEEVADVAIYLLELCELTGINLIDAINDKISKNAKKYPNID